MPNPIVHWELNTKDAKKTQEFLASLFGWHVDANNPMNYGMIDTHTEKGADGGIHDSDEAPKGTMVYVEVDDLQAYLDKAESLGGKTVMPIVVIPNMVTMAQFSDPQGNVFGLVKSEG